MKSKTASKTFIQLADLKTQGTRTELDLFGLGCKDNLVFRQVTKQDLCQLLTDHLAMAVFLPMMMQLPRKRLTN